MVDIRYHIYSLAAVFMALAVGIVIGTSFARGSPSAEVGRKTIQRYESDMRRLKAEIQKASRSAQEQEAMARNCQDFCRALMPIVIKDKLAWRPVAIVQTGDDDELTGSVKQALEMAGANVSSVTEMSREFPFEDYAHIAQTLLKSGIQPENIGKNDRDRLFSIIAETIQSGKYAEVLSKLEAAGVATFTGDYFKYNKLVVIVGGASSEESNRAEAVDTHLIAQFEKLGVRTVGCEASNAKISYVPVWHKMGIATVDNADSAIGQIAMIYALNGETARFGFKETAERVIPQSLESR